MSKTQIKEPEPNVCSLVLYTTIFNQRGVVKSEIIAEFPWLRLKEEEEEMTHFQYYRSSITF